MIPKILVFESNSQRKCYICLWYLSCCWYQRYSFLKAIHNDVALLTSSLSVVVDTKDTRFWKQFTTLDHLNCSVSTLLLIPKILVFESNSQLLVRREQFQVCCCWYQRYSFLKAIHNQLNCNISVGFVVVDTKDTRFWKQFTTS